MSAYPVRPPAPAPDPPELRPVSPPPVRKHRAWWLAIVAAAVVVSASVWWRPQDRPKSATPPAVGTVKALRGLLQHTVRLTGSVTATRFANIFAPQVQAPDSGRGMVLTYLPPSGSTIHPGDRLVEIDSQSVRDHLIDVENQVHQGEMELRKLRARQDEETEAFRQRLRVARGQLEQRRQDVRALATRSRIDQELLKLSLEEAQATFDEAGRQVAMTAQRQEAQWNLQQLNQNFQLRHRNRHRHDLEVFTMRAPIAGQVVLKPIRRGLDRGQIQVGDEVNPGQAILQIADLSGLEMEASVNQAESELIRLGQKATIRFDAYPDIALPGRVKAIGTLAASGRRVNYQIRTVAVRIAIEGSDPRVIPDSTVSADVVIGERGNSVIVPRQAVGESDGRPVVWVRREDGGFTPREVELGQTSNTAVAVLSGLDGGEEVALQPPY